MAIPRFVIYTSTDSIQRVFPLLDFKLVECLIVSSEPLAVKTRHSVVVTSDLSLGRTLSEGFKADSTVDFLTETPADVEVSVLTADGARLNAKCYAKEAVLREHEELEVRLLDRSSAEAALFEHVTVDKDIDTAVSVTYKVEMAAIALLRRFYAQFPSVPAPEDPTPVAFDFNLDEEISERTLRGLFNPPKSVAVVAASADTKATLVEDIVSLEKLRAEVSQSKLATLPAATKDTSFYTNVGGSIVKAGTDIKTVVASGTRLRMNEPLPGVNIWRYVGEVLTSGWLGVEGPFVRLLERRFAALCGGVGAVAVNSGTGALWGALKALGVGEGAGGQIVLCPSFTCAACADAVVHAGGRAVIVDCELNSYGVSYDAVVRAMGDLNASGAGAVFGVVVAPCYGVPARDLLRIHELCKRRGAFLIEDNCESYGASIEGSQTRLRLGEIGDMSVVSIRSEKMVGVGEGGVIMSKSQSLVDKARWWCSRAPTRGVGLWRVYEHDEVGMNYRLPELLGAVGCAAIENLPVMVTRKRQIHQWYEEQVASRPDLEIAFQKTEISDSPVWWINALVLSERLRDKAELVGMTLTTRRPRVEIRPGFYPLNKMKPFAALAQDCPNAAELYARMVCLPSSPLLTRDNVGFICQGLFEVIDDFLAGNLI